MYRPLLQKPESLKSLGIEVHDLRKQSLHLSISNIITFIKQLLITFLEHKTFYEKLFLLSMRKD